MNAQKQNETDRDKYICVWIARSSFQRISICKIFRLVVSVPFKILFARRKKEEVQTRPNQRRQLIYCAQISGFTEFIDFRLHERLLMGHNRTPQTEKKINFYPM